MWEARLCLRRHRSPMRIFWGPRKATEPGIQKNAQRSDSSGINLVRNYLLLTPTHSALQRNRRTIRFFTSFSKKLLLCRIDGLWPFSSSIFQLGMLSYRLIGWEGNTARAEKDWGIWSGDWHCDVRLFCVRFSHSLRSRPGRDIRTASGTIPSYVRPPAEPSPGFSTASLSGVTSPELTPSQDRSR